MAMESLNAPRPASAARAPHELAVTPLPLSAAEEKRIAREFSVKIAWPTLALAVALPVAYLAIAQAGWVRAAPLPVCAIALTVLAYAHYTLVHEAVHDNIVPGHPRLRWLNPVVGWIGALGLGYNWPSLMRTHVLHHAHTNTEEDPDIWVKGGFGGLFLKGFAFGVVLAVTPRIIMRRVLPARYHKATGVLSGSEAIQADAVTLAVLATLVYAISAGRIADWLWLLLIPAVTANVLLAIFFQWLPHYPFDRTGRYFDTRISHWPGAGFLTLQQNLHLIHHLWPGVPFYRYAALYRRLRPTLQAKGSRIEGFLTGRYAKDLSASRIEAA